MDTAARADAVEAFLASASALPAFGVNGKLTQAAESFLRGVFEDYAGEALEIGDVLALASDFWRWIGEQERGAQNVRLRPALGAGGRPLQLDALEIVGPDMPFLVDSLMGELADQSIAPLALAHPIGPSPSGETRSYIQILMRTLRGGKGQTLISGVRATLADVRTIVADFVALKQRMRDAALELESAATSLPREEVAEAKALLDWLIDNRFTFLGARDYAYARDAGGQLLPAEPIMLEETGLGLLRDPARFVLRATSEPLLLTPEWKRLLNEPTPLVVAKSTLRSRVHRRTAADYVGVKRYDARGQVSGEIRFIGLFTTEAFTDGTREIPVLRRKADWAVAHAGFRRGGHSEKALRHVIETLPREELWKVTPQELLTTAREIVNLMDRPRPRAFVRRDRFNRFVSALVFLPKERFNSVLREAVGKHIADAFGGVVETFEPHLGEGALARVHFSISDIDPSRPDPDPVQLDADIAAMTRTWEDAFDEVLAGAARFDEAAREEVRARFAHAFSAAYRERFSADEALEDISEILRLTGDVSVRAYRLAGDGEDALRCKLYARGDLLPLSATLPIFENMGLFVASEQNYEITTSAGVVHLHELMMRNADGSAMSLSADGAFEDAFAAIWAARAENDGFNRVILKLGVVWRQAALLRALARYRQQSGLDPSQMAQELALASYPEITSFILALFRVRFDRDLPEDKEARSAWAKELNDKIIAALNSVPSLDDDRVLRRIALLVNAIVRTNFYQRDEDGAEKAHISFKVASRELADLPAPKPFREIWVSSPVVEGVHLRFGPVARGGLRWSDRRDDFRTEVLDLVKAQQVKNAIIVPVGSKGGFFPKRLPPRGAPNFQEAGIEAYRVFLRGLLDITDNLEGGEVRAPDRVVRWDEDDPYLVVAADKGTATFSDIANAMAREYGFWLDDAFASGGSAGYDHKAMGITARGAWEAVKRHFREIGKDIQTTPFDVIGVGDMSGDVFGNAMLLSKQIRLVAAFDHRHIFLDPAPKDLEATWSERNRMFALPRSSWDDYNKSLISEGGGVFARSLKTIELSPQAAAVAGVKPGPITPGDLIAALVKAKCELLFFGGIGTFIKARVESHAAVGDKGNDVLRADAEDVRALVIGEGANLGVTQAGRIAYARAGGRINTDAIDNSAGVDTSDHEVNIKILLGDMIRGGVLKAEDRDTLLAAMTDDVAAHVLAHNYDQTLALSLAEASAAADLDSDERLMERLEASGKLSRAVEGLPSPEAVRALRAAKAGLTRPELSKLIAYAKIDLFDALVASETPDDPAFETTLVSYFPPQLAHGEPQMKRHRLRREIISTTLADDLVNLGGPTFVDRIRETARCEPALIARAFEAARRIFRLDELSAAINALDNTVPAATQTRLHQEIANAARRVVIYLARRAPVSAKGVGGVVAMYADAVAAQRAEGARLLTELEHARFEERAASFAKAGAPPELAETIALIAPQTATLDAADLAERRGLPVLAAAHLHRAVGAAFGLDRMRAAAATLPLEAHWDRLAMRRTIEELFEDQRVLADAAAASGAPKDRESAERVVREWVAGFEESASSLKAIADMEADGGWSFAKIMLAAAELHALASAARA